MDKTSNFSLNDSERQVCEIWTRVMGYHRPVSQWNPGKVGEYNDRKFFKLNLNSPFIVIAGKNEAQDATGRINTFGSCADLSCETCHHSCGDQEKADESGESSEQMENFSYRAG